MKATVTFVGDPRKTEEGLPDGMISDPAYCTIFGVKFLLEQEKEVDLPKEQIDKLKANSHFEFVKPASKVVENAADEAKAG